MYGVFLFSTQFLLPVIISTAAYINIIGRLAQRSTRQSLREVFKNSSSAN